MANGSNIKRYTAAELRTLQASGQSKTDLAALDAMTDDQVESEFADDADFAGEPTDWYKSAEAVMPKQKTMLTIRLDDDVVQWFRARGPGYQTRINAVLRAFVMNEENGRKRA